MFEHNYYTSDFRADIEKGEVEDTVPSALPTGCTVFFTLPDLLFIPEIIFGTILGNLIFAIPFTTTLMIHGFVLAVFCFCYIGTLAIMAVYVIGAHKNTRVWTNLDVYYHFVAATLYISAGIINAIGTSILKYQSSLNNELNIIATVCAFIVAALYSIHAVLSLRRKMQGSP